MPPHQNKPSVRDRLLSYSIKGHRHEIHVLAHAGYGMHTSDPERGKRPPTYGCGLEQVLLEILGFLYSPTIENVYQSNNHKKMH